MTLHQHISEHEVLFRAAAALLSEHVARVEANWPSPWRLHRGEVLHSGDPGAYDRAYVCNADGTHADAYIALMGPDIGAALFGLLTAAGESCRRWVNAVEECRIAGAAGEDCGCATKDCYECGPWHSCTHTAPSLQLAGVARTLLAHATGPVPTKGT